ncbi:MAG: hypothetical protein JNL03_08295, partial [Prolixibacteraceae bacterium]|nr:hypothetical protein [Prolixibacteraceae bacterium]
MKKSQTFFVAFILSVASYAQNFLSLDLKANKLLYDGKRNKIYATVNSLDVNQGNNVVQINPSTGVIENSVFVGSDPNIMTFTKDTNYLYVALEGASFVKRVNLNNFTVDRSISLGATSNGAMYAQDIATVKLDNDLVVVARKYTSISPVHAGVAAYLRGTKLPSETASHTGSNLIESANDTNFVVGFNIESTEAGMRKMNIDTISGVTLIRNTQNMGVCCNPKFHNGLIYTDNGKIFDPLTSPPSVVGTCVLGSGGQYRVEPDFKKNRIYFCSVENKLKIIHFNLQTLAYVGNMLVSDTYPNDFQSPETEDVIRFGENGLAVIIGQGYFFSNKDKRVVLLKMDVLAGV